MRLYVGTSGYSYKEWKGIFYPEDLPDSEMLRFYSRNLPAVEINNTFYRMPGEAMLTTWAERVPPDFRFVLKASRKITHSKPLKNKDDEVKYLFKTAEKLEDKLGAIFFQLPPYLRRDIGLLSDFLKIVPSSSRAVFEFRHRSWFDDEPEALCEIMRNNGCAICCSDSENKDLAKLIATTDWGYLRLRRPDYSETDLLDWTRRIKSQDWHSVYVFFKHEDSAMGPQQARHFLDLAVPD
jgi:uncharacterized protein YecE (DUF72 family)